MNITEYHIPTPDTLESLMPLVTSGDINALKTVWNADRKQHGGRSKWDSTVRIRLETEKHSRKAYIVRSDKHGLDKTCAQLMYLQTARYCKSSLVMVSDSRDD